jgi:hypothetical protein
LFSKKGFKNLIVHEKYMTAIQNKMDSFDKEIREDISDYLEGISNKLDHIEEIGIFPYEVKFLDATISKGKAKLFLEPERKFEVYDFDRQGIISASVNSCSIRSYVEDADLTHLMKIVDMLVEKGYKTFIPRKR